MELTEKKSSKLSSKMKKSKWSYFYQSKMRDNVNVLK